MSAKEKKPKKEKKVKEKKEKAVKGATTKICPACRAEIPIKEKVCSFCGEKQKGKSRLPLIAGVAVVVLLVAAIVSMALFEFPIPLPFKIPFLGPSDPETVLGEVMELTGEQEESVLTALGECGFGEIKEVDHIKTGVKTSSYAVNDASTARYMEGEDAIVVEIANETKALESVTYQDHDIYIGGHVIAQITDFYMDGDTRDGYLSDTLAAVRAKLDFPETATFPSRSGWHYTMDGENVIVESSVTFRNTSGSEETQTFQALFEGGELSSLTFSGGEEE